MDQKSVSLAVIKRMPRYYRYLGDLLDSGITRISSKELSQRMNITASQIRQDLNNFGCFGQQGYGYNVELLYGEIKRILGLEKKYSLIIIGAGNIGQALVNYINFERRGFNFVALFDVNPKLIGLTIRGISIHDIDTLGDFLTKNQVDIAVLTLPKTAAVKAANEAIKGGVKGIWNFSHIDIDAPESVMVENVHLTDSLMTLSYKLGEQGIISRFADME
jgi:redox-sensing transcriptional repressor